MTEDKALCPTGLIFGMEFGSTRIKAVITDRAGKVIASGSCDWENRLENGIWTYSMDEIRSGLQECYRKTAEDYRNRYGAAPVSFDAMGFSGMMHGYLAFDGDMNLLTPFRTWRNTITEEAAGELTRLLDFNIPQRWSIAHLYQAILNGEAHVPEIRYLTTLSGYIHVLLTGQHVLGIGEASGMFPIDSAARDYDGTMLEKFDAAAAAHGFTQKARSILPRVLCAGENAGMLTAEGAALLDPTGNLQPGIPLCPPEGDAGTGMTATDSVAVRTGNVSAGTSIFSMVVLERPLSRVYTEIDLVTTPDGSPVGMVHCNNCTSELNAWVGLLREFAALTGRAPEDGELFPLLFRKAAEGDADCGGILSCNYLSGEPLTGFAEGRPLTVRTPGSRMTLANFMRSQIYAALVTLKIGMELLCGQEKVRVDRLMGHGGLFKTPLVGQKILASAVGAPVSVMENAGEGGAWGIALLAGYMLRAEKEQTLSEYLDTCIFADAAVTTVGPDDETAAGFETYTKQFKALLACERAAVENL